jgi:hypothetical protein
MEKNKLITKTHRLRNGYHITVQHVNGVSHLEITDNNCYPDNDSRYEDRWRYYGLLIPINDDEDFNAISKMLNEVSNEIN